MTGPRPYNLVAELTYRCPLRCAYCSNPLDFGRVPDALDTADWIRVFQQAADLGVVHVGLTGGEPLVRRDLAEIVAGATQAGIYTHLVTSGSDSRSLGELQHAGLRSVQLSIQDSRARESDRMAGTAVFDRKLHFAREVRTRGMPLTLNFVLHRSNLARVTEIVDLARRLDADRLELANAQYYGWALRNRAALLPSKSQLEEAADAVAQARREAARPEILFVLPDYAADRPKPCMGGWGRRTMVVTPAGLVLPCHAAAEIPGLEFHSVQEHSLEECWNDAPGLNAFRGEAWMPEPCRSCPDRTLDFGGCRCQAFLLTGDAGVTDPACALAPQHEIVLAAREEAAAAERDPNVDGPDLVYRESTRAVSR